MGRVQLAEPSDPFWSLRAVLIAALAALLAPTWRKFLLAFSFRHEHAQA